jgi:hypothetical protein
MNFYFNSISDLLDSNGIFAEKTDQWFKQIQNNMKDDIICRYRSILNVYSQEWPSVNEIGRIQFSRRHRLSPSLNHNVHSMIIARYLGEWVEEINNVIMNLEMKFF